MVEAFWNSVSHAPLLSVGINCALGAKEMRPYVEELSGLAPVFLTAYPNAGLPNAFGGFDETPEIMCTDLGGVRARGLGEHRGRLLRHDARPHPRDRGGRAGTSRRAAIPEVPRADPPLSGLEPLHAAPDGDFTVVGERTNVTGSPKFSKLVLAGDYEGALAVARQQVEGGANVLDVNMDEGMLDGVAAMTRFLNLVSAEPDIAKLPIMLDSSKWDVIEAGLKCLQGKAVVNSISLKEGEDAFRAPRAPRAALRRRRDRHGVRRGGPGHDRRAQGRDRRARLPHPHGGGRLPARGRRLRPERPDGRDGHRGARRLRARVLRGHAPHQGDAPATRRSPAAISNVSFSFRGNDAVREAMHAAFLYHAIRAGLDMGIVNAGQLAVYEEIPKDLLERVEDVLLNRRPDATERLLAFAESVKQAGPSEAKADAWRSGSGRGAPLPRARPGHRGLRRGGRRGGPRRSSARPLDVIEGPLMAGHERRRRPLRRREDVPAAGRQERARHEAGRRVPRAVPGGGEGAGASTLAGQDPPRDRQGRRPRHRQEHRRRRPRLQRLRGDRPRRHGARGPHPEGGERARRRRRRPLRPHHALPRRDGRTSRARWSARGSPCLFSSAEPRRAPSTRP